GEVVISAFEQHRIQTLCPIAVTAISTADADRYNKTSLVSGMNSIAGVRMEERSPGSYRLSIRGSSLRSPFGVRNVKVYWNNIPVTDAGGNTYFNEFAFNNFASIEVFKGPVGSMYGAGTGGLILLNSFDNSWKPGAQAEYVTGSYGLQNILLTARFGDGENRNIVTYAHNQSDGYRDHTYSRKDNVSLVTQLRHTERQQLTGSFFYTDMFYETPGGLTKAEWTANPRQARPAAGAFPSAAGAKAGIYQKTFIAGLTNQYVIAPSFKNTTTVSGTFAQVKNPTFRNYERRIEPGPSGRTVFSYEKSMGESKLQWVLGGEWQEGYYNTQVSNNRSGFPDTLQTNDDIRYNNFSVFTQGDINIRNSWFITAGASMNRAEVSFRRLNVYPVKVQGVTYKNEWAPRLAVLKKIGRNNSVFASVTKGFSPPGISELLPSTGIITTDLQAEEGVNYELGARAALLQNHLRLELIGFYFNLDHALVTRKDASNADYYVNAGNTKQRGIEATADYNRFFYHSFIRYVNVQAAFTLSDFTYGSYQKGTVSYNGNKLPGVPGRTLSFIGDVQAAKGYYVSASWYASSKLYFDDANTVSADSYQLLGGRIGWKSPSEKAGLKLGLYAGADNLLDENYSLGNDINATGGRYYNAAPGRNYYIGATIGWTK
ncbi:MAG: TonB-dependent receptor, partial [Bacteroidetes bacterium]|nr:TonB-dependent receptor [Bacteroidota bacterium]